MCRRAPVMQREKEQKTRAGLAPDLYFYLLPGTHDRRHAGLRGNEVSDQSDS